MKNMFISYRGNERSRVKEVEKGLQDSGLCHKTVNDLNKGNLQDQLASVIWKNIKPLMDACSGLILLIGDTTHSPKVTLNHELDYAISNNWYIFGISLSNRTGSPSEKVRNYPKYVPLTYDFPKIVSAIVQRILCN